MRRVALADGAIQVPSVAETQLPSTDPKLLATLGGMAALTRPFNYLIPGDEPACGFDESGLPLAFQLVGGGPSMRRA